MDTTLASDFYDPNGGDSRESPGLQPKTLHLRITPSPPPGPTEVYVTPSGRRASDRLKVSDSRRNAALVRFMGDGRNPGIFILAGERPLSDPPESEDSSESDDGPGEERKAADPVGTVKDFKGDYVNNSDGDRNCRSLAAWALAPVGIKKSKPGSPDRDVNEMAIRGLSSAVAPAASAVLSRGSNRQLPPRECYSEEYSSSLKPESMALGALSLEDQKSSTSPGQDQATAIGGVTGGQNPNYAPANAYASDVNSERMTDQSQLLTPASAATPRDAASSSAASTTFQPLSSRDDRSVGSTAAASLATPSSIHSPSIHSPEYSSPYSPKSGGSLASSGRAQSFASLSQVDHHSLPRPTGSNALPSLPPIIGSPPHIDANDATGPSATNSAGASASNTHPNRTILPPIREHLASPLAESSPKADGRQPPFSQSSPTDPRLSSFSHHSPPISPNEMYRRGRDPASPNGSVSSNGHLGSQYHFPPMYDNRGGTSAMGGIGTSLSEHHYATAGAGGPTSSPGHPGHLMLAPATSTSPSSQAMLEKSNGIYHQQLTIAALTAQPPSQSQQQQQQQQKQQAASSGAYVCTVPGCMAAPFQTPYLLNSHANVHSSVRPHYCPVPGCPRGQQGKGFKRKNEMIRHGLVHQSPGYVCPFCPDREHKYPRPDNLQRHVRMHHKDKNKEDPLLRDVLAQRLDGHNKTRRRRLG